MTPLEFLENLQAGWDATMKLSVVRIVVLLIFYLLILFVLLRLTEKTFNRYRGKFNPSLIDGTKGLAKIFIISMVFTAYLNQFEQFRGVFLGYAAILGTAIGFASQQSIGNFVAGLYLLVTRPFEVNDYIILPSLNVEGIVKEMKINYTVILLPNQTKVLITNRTLLDARIINTKIRVDPPEKEKNTEDGSDHMSSRKSFNWSNLIKPLVAARKEVIYAYPLQIGIDPNLFHRFEKAIVEASKNHGSKLISEPSWYVVLKTRLETKYEVVLLFEDSYAIFDVVSDFLNTIERSLSIQAANAV